MNSRFLGYILLLFLSIFLVQNGLYAEGKKGITKSPAKIKGSPTETYLDINKISTTVYNNGKTDIDNSGNSGFEYPKGSGRFCVFQSGFLWGARVPGDPQVRVGGSAYGTGLQPGKILADGTAENSNNANVRLYRVRPDIYPGGPSIDLTADAAREGLSASALLAQYIQDWNEWPASDGAPTWIDTNGTITGVKMAVIPGVRGASQTIWFVANDLNANNTRTLYGADPLGIEYQATYWAYNQSGALGNMIFRKYKIINKSGKPFVDMYVSMFSDPDDGYAGDDYAGCDTTLSLGYCYNANATDANYTPLPPPAVGFDFFQGPKVAGVAGQDLNKNGVDDALDSAIVNGKKIGPGFINLPMTAFYYFANGDANVTDPKQSSIEGSDQFYNFFQGRVGLTGKMFVNPITGDSTTYVLSGDPQANTGWLDGNVIAAGDRRIGLASGPFNMAASDTQEIVVAEIAAGAVAGIDRLAAVGILKYYDKTAQTVYDSNFDFAGPPSPPEVNLIGLDKKIVIDWGYNNDAVARTENVVSKGYAFEGYNVYQMPSASTTNVSEGKLIATFDVVNDVKVIKSYGKDPVTGEIVIDAQAAQNGSDSGIKRYLIDTVDKVGGNIAFVNGTKYYFAVTAYNYQAGVIPADYETAPKVISVTPQSALPGVVASKVSGDTLTVAHSAGTSDGSVVPVVVDQSKLTGNSYKITFDYDTTAGVYLWNLTNLTTNKVLLSQQENQSGDDSYTIVDGMIVKTIGPPNGVGGYSIPSGVRKFTNGNTTLGFEGFGGAIGWEAPNHYYSGGDVGVPASQLKTVLLKLAKVTDTVEYNPTFDLTDANVSYGYRYMRGCANPAALPEFAPYIINPGSSYSFQIFEKNVPLSAWDITTDPAHPRRLAVGFLENNVAGGLVDGKWWPGKYDLYDNAGPTGPREWLFVFDADYSETVNPAYAVNASSKHLPIMYWLEVSRRSTADASASQFSPTGTGTDQFEIIPNFINTTADTFFFSAPKVGYSREQAQAAVEKINVYPNPYYGVNPQEASKYSRFVTFTHLPSKAKIRIFNLAGVLVKTIDHLSSTSQFERWDLTNENTLPVASGLYIAYIDMPEVGKTKIVKLAIIQEQQILDHF